MTPLELAIYLGRAKMRSLPMYSAKRYEFNTAIAEMTRKWREANNLRSL